MEIQTPVQQVPETQKSSKKWLVPISLAAVVVAGAFLYAYLAPVQNDENVDGKEQQVKAGETVVVYTRQKDLPPREYNKQPSATELVVANIDGTEKKIVFSTAEDESGGDRKNYTRIASSVLSKYTGELVFRDSSSDGVRRLVARSLRDATDRVLFEGPGIGPVLSTDGGAVGLLLMDYMKPEDQPLQVAMIPLLGDSAVRRIELFPELLEDEYLGEASLLFWDRAGKIVVNIGSGGTECKWGKPIIFDKDGKRMHSENYFKDMEMGGGLLSPDGSWYASRLRLPDSRDEVCGVVSKGLALQYMDVPGDPMVVEVEGYKTPEFWTEDSKRFVYSWEESEPWDGIREIYAEFFPYSNAVEKIEDFYTRRYGIFDVETRATSTFNSKSELNAWLATNYPDESYFEVLYRGEQKPWGKKPSGTQLYRVSAVAGELWVNGVLVERTENKNLYQNEIEVLGFATIPE